MGLLNSLKDAANKALNVADQKLGKAIDSASSLLISEPEPKPAVKDISEILHNLVFNKEQYEKAIAICNNKIYSDDPWESLVAYFYRAVCNYSKAIDIDIDAYPGENEEERAAYKVMLEDRFGLLESALNDTDASLAISDSNGYPDMVGLNIHYKATILDAMNRREEARRWFILDMKSDFKSDAKSAYNRITDNLLSCFNQYKTIDEDNRELRKLFEEDGYPADFIESEIKDQERFSEEWRFLNHYSFGERQFIFIVKSVDKIAGCFDRDEIINWVFTLDKLPEELVFPVGHPQANTLYVAHPAQRGYYLPYEGAEELIFHEKIEEFCRLAQCLGATEISFNSIKGESVSKSFTSKLNAGGNVGAKGNSVGGGFTQDRADSRASELHKEVGYSYTLHPNKVYVPTDTNWLDIDKSWKSFVKQRIESNILSYTKRISSSEAINISGSLQKSAKASFENLMLNVNGNFSIESDSTFSKNTNSEWEIQIQFASLDELELIEQQEDSDTQSIKQIDQELSASLSDAEEKYKEEVLFILEDGEITDTERRFLERKRIKLGLSEEQAAKVEAMCSPSLTEAEKEYIEIYKEIVGKDEVSDRKRRMLNREAESLGLSEERAKELEKSLLGD